MTTATDRATWVLPLLVTDGDCGFCTRSIEWGRKRIRRLPVAVPYQRADLAALGLDEAACRTAVQFVDGDGRIRYLVDPGINGAHAKRPDGSEVKKLDAPKAVLISYIIKGILDRELPWELVIFGAMISLVMELAGVPSLAFAVGVYLPIATTVPTSMRSSSTIQPPMQSAAATEKWCIRFMNRFIEYLNQ